MQPWQFDHQTDAASLAADMLPFCSMQDSRKTAEQVCMDGDECIAYPCDQDCSFGPLLFVECQHLLQGKVTDDIAAIR